jgi:excinuclease ABC subunit B
MAYNERHGITPRSVVRAVQESLQMAQAEVGDGSASEMVRAGEDEAMYDKASVIAQLEKQMREASAQLEFELAAHLRDQIKALKEGQGQLAAPPLSVKRRKK